MDIQKDIYERKTMKTIFVFKKGIFWLAWIYSRDYEDDLPYYDNSQTVAFHSAGIEYLSITFTQKRALKNIKKYLKRTGQLDESPES